MSEMATSVVDSRARGHKRSSLKENVEEGSPSETHRDTEGVTGTAHIKKEQQ